MLVLLLTITSENWYFHFQSLEKFFVLVFSLPRILAVPYISLAFTLFSIAYYWKCNRYLSSVEAKCNLNIGLVEIYFVTKNFLLVVCVQEISPYGGQEQCAREEYTCDCLEINNFNTLNKFKVLKSIMTS